MARQVGGDDHLIAGTDAQGRQRQLEGRGAVAQTDAVPGAAIGGPLGLEPVHGFAADEGRAVDHMLSD
jgi:hypothetical protein